MTTQELLIWEGIQSAKFIKGTQLQSGVISTYLALLHNNSRSAAYVTLKITVASEEASSKKNPKPGRISELTLREAECIHLHCLNRYECGQLHGIPSLRRSLWHRLYLKSKIT